MNMALKVHGSPVDPDENGIDHDSKTSDEKVPKTRRKSSRPSRNDLPDISNRYILVSDFHCIIRDFFDIPCTKRSLFCGTVFGSFLGVSNRFFRNGSIIDAFCLGFVTSFMVVWSQCRHFYEKTLAESKKCVVDDTELKLFFEEKPAIYGEHVLSAREILYPNERMDLASPESSKSKVKGVSEQKDEKLRDRMRENLRDIIIPAAKALKNFKKSLVEYDDFVPYPRKRFEHPTVWTENDYLPIFPRCEPAPTKFLTGEVKSQPLIWKNKYSSRFFRKCPPVNLPSHSPSVDDLKVDYRKALRLYPDVRPFANFELKRIESLELAKNLDVPLQFLEDMRTRQMMQQVKDLKPSRFVLTIFEAVKDVPGCKVLRTGNTVPYPIRVQFDETHLGSLNGRFD